MPPVRPGLAYAALAVLDTALAAGPPRARRARVVTKPLLMPALAVARPAGPGVLAAQALSWGGDLALLGSGRRAFLTGLGSFFGAHLAYVAAFRGRSTVPLLAAPGRRGALAAGGALALAMAAAARRRDPALAAPVATYGLALTTMAVASATVPEQGRAQVVAGTLLFLLSDSLIGVRKFMLGERSPALEAAVMATYTAGQWCIAAGLTTDATAAVA